MGTLFYHNNTILLNATLHNSTTENGTSGVDLGGTSPNWSGLRLIQICCYILIAVVGSLGNILTIIVLLKPQNRSKTSSILLLNLAVCDVFIAAIGIPLDLGELIPGNWYYGKELCNIIYPFQTSLPMVSSWTLMFMLAERNMIFSRHITTGLRARAVRLLAFLTWVLPLALVVPYGFKLSLAPGDTENAYTCSENWSRPVDRQIYTVALFVSEYLVPIVAITLFVANIGAYLRTERQSFRKNALGLDQRTSKRRMRTNIRLTMIFIVIVSLYAALKLPNNVFWLWVEFGGGGESPYFDTIWTSVGLCSYSTSMTNPFVLGAMSADFRQEFVKILACRGCCCNRKKTRGTFSPFSTSTIVSYKRINKMGKVMIEASGNTETLNAKRKSFAASYQKTEPEAISPNWKRKPGLSRSTNRRRTFKYKYEDLLPDSRPESPANGPSKVDKVYIASSPLVDIDFPDTNSGKTHVVSILQEQSCNANGKIDGTGDNRHTRATFTSDGDSQPSLNVVCSAESSDDVRSDHSDELQSCNKKNCMSDRNSGLSEKRADSGIHEMSDSSSSKKDIAFTIINTATMDATPPRAWTLSSFEECATKCLNGKQFEPSKKSLSRRRSLHDQSSFLRRKRTIKEETVKRQSNSFPNLFFDSNKGLSSDSQSHFKNSQATRFRKKKSLVGFRGISLQQMLSSAREVGKLV